uniref:hypothetical protein n=1 Tax=uncultured Muribaculum sp. TaxID=1918613 RepID=UPI0027121F53
ERIRILFFPVHNQGLIAKKYAERCGIKHNLNALYTFKAFQHAEKAICESNCKKSMLKVVGL